MSQIPIPKIDPRRSKEIYEQALALAGKYCPEWAPADNGEDMGVAILKLFSRLAENTIEQLNRVPEKHQLAFYDFIGMDHMPPAPARVPLTFALTEGSKQAMIPARTKVASAQDPTVIFETLEPLTAVLFPLDSLYSLNPWTDSYTEHPLSDDNGGGYFPFGGDGTEKPMEHVFYLADDLLNFSFPIDFDLRFDLQNYEPGIIDYSPGQDKDMAELCEAIKMGGFDLGDLKAAENTIEWLIELFHVPDLLEKILAKQPGLKLTDEMKKLKDLTEQIRKKAFKSLSISEQNLIIGLNELIIKAVYPALKSGSYVLQVNFIQQTVSKKVISGAEANWLTFRSSIPLQLQKENLPVIKNITLSITAQGAPDAVLFNNVPVDVKKGFYPFGETPKIGDALYIGAGELFSKANSSIALNLNLRGGVAATDGNNKTLLLIWEHWDGTAWTEFMRTDKATETDPVKTLTTTPATTTTGSITFTCPAIQTTKINGIESKWIRVRIDAGGYGIAAQYDIQSNTDIVNTLAKQDERIKSFSEKIIELLKTNGISLGMKYAEATFIPPFINSLSITCSHSKEIKDIQRCTTYNNFSYKTIDLAATDSQNNLLKPYELSDEPSPAFYLGFDEYPANNPISLYFSLKGYSSREPHPRIKTPAYAGNFDFADKVQGLAWEYYSANKSWVKIGPEDGTHQLIQSGIVTCILSSDIQKISLFNKERNWLRLRLKEGSWFDSPRLKGIDANTVWAENARVINDELLGSSNGEPGQTFTFSARPILERQVIEIQEPSVPSEKELSVILSEGEEDPLRLVKNASGDIQEVWVRWLEVSSFLHSEPSSRHYVMDRVEGKIIFGDGVHGMIPPPLPNNVLARTYKSGGGKQGNQKAGTLTELKTAIPNIQGVVNPDASSGGADLETIENILERTPHSIKNRDRAVTQEDFEWLAREASQEVAKTRCLKREDGSIGVIIAPLYLDGNLYPETSLKEQVGAYLKERSYAFIREKIIVADPDYAGICVDTTIVPVSLAEGAVVAERVESRLREYLEPITGGQDQKGWEFGASIFRSKIAALIEDVEGVDYVKSLTIYREAGENTDTAISPFLGIGEEQLPKPGRITITLSGGER